MQPEKSSLETFSIALYCKFAEISIYHARFCLKHLSDSVIVGLKIGVDAPGVLAALRPWYVISQKWHNVRIDCRYSILLHWIGLVTKVRNLVFTFISFHFRILYLFRDQHQGLFSRVQATL